MLLNLVFVLSFVVAGRLLWKAKTNKGRIQIILVTVLVWVIYAKAHPSYMPKGDIKRADIPSLSTGSTAEIEDRLRKPVPSEVRNAEQERQYREGAPSLK